MPDATRVIACGSIDGHEETRPSFACQMTMNAADPQRRRRSARPNVRGDEADAAIWRGGDMGEGVKWHGSNVRSAGDSSCQGVRNSQADAARAAVRGYGNTATASPPRNSRPRPCSWRCGSNSSGWDGSSGGRGIAATPQSGERKPPRRAALVRDRRHWLPAAIASDHSAIKSCARSRETGSTPSR